MERRETLYAAEGGAIGAVSSVLFLAAQVAASWAAGSTWTVPLRMLAGVVAGPRALAAESGVAAWALLGVAVALALGSVAGLVHGMVVSCLPRPQRTSLLFQVGLGLLWGELLWLVGMRGVASVAFPWFLDLPQRGQALVFMLGYGLPVGVLTALVHRRAAAARAVPA